jgi:7,8-dihydropterin-6-yl-methyl-4-(beta-D-ribofuranosyl)aminobenzene 5'-phosphate synthase
VHDLRILFDNIPFEEGLTSGWGFSAVVRGYSKIVLFDTGSDGDVLLGNMRAVGLDPKEIDVVVISHPHHDHTGGLPAFLAVNPDVDVLLPHTASQELVLAIAEAGATFTAVADALEIIPGVISTGSVRGITTEQALILLGEDCATLLTGCAHPGIIDLLEVASRKTGGPVTKVVGGLHLIRKPRRSIRRIAEAMLDMGVSVIAPSHCTGDHSIEILADVFGDGFVKSGLGQTIPLDEVARAVPRG